MEPKIIWVSYTSYECPVCGREIVRDLAIFLSHAKRHIFEVLKRDHPEWQSSGEAYVAFEKYYEGQLHGWQTKEGPDDDPTHERSA